MFRQSMMNEQITFIQRTPIRKPDHYHDSCTEFMFFPQKINLLPIPQMIWLIKQIIRILLSRLEFRKIKQVQSEI